MHYLSEVGSTVLIRVHSHCGGSRVGIGYITGPVIELPATIWGGCDTNHSFLAIAMGTGLGGSKTTTIDLDAQGMHYLSEVGGDLLIAVYHYSGGVSGT